MAGYYAYLAVETFEPENKAASVAASFISYPTQLERRRVLGAGLNAYPTNDCLFFPI